MHKLSKKPVVFVGLSGGVDSSVAAALLKQQGFEVVGVFMKNWSDDVPGGYCSAEADFADVRAVCQHLDIPYYTFNFEKEYKERVLQYFFNEYKAGRTPNPDVMCNKEIKFDLFLKKSLSLGADFIATGHYAQVVTSRHPELVSGSSHKILKREANELVVKSSLSSRAKSRDLAPDSSMGACPERSRGGMTQGKYPVCGTRYLLLKGNDPIKDQTYFLYNLTQAQLAKTLFPVGMYPKSKVRALAKKFKLPTATKKDSQGICFIGPVDVKEFLKTVIKPKTGKIVNQEGKVLGSHEGAWFYTIGQRRVAGLAGQSEPLYVINTDIKKNLVMVGPDSATYGKAVVLEDLHLTDPTMSLREVPYENGTTKQSSCGSARLPRRSAPRNDKMAEMFSMPLTAKPRYGPEVYSGRLVKVTSSEKRETSELTMESASLSSRAKSRDLAPDSSMGACPERSRGGMTKGKGKKSSPRTPLLAPHYSFVFDAPQRALTAGQSLVIYDGKVCLGGGVIKAVIK